MPNRTDRSERGAVLILALVFLVAVSLVVVALVGWTGNDLNNIANFKTARSLEYATGGAAQLEIENLRYSYTASTSGAITCTPGGGISTTIDGQAISVFCSVVLNPTSATTRTITIDACAASLALAACTSNPFLQAVVTFDDYSSSNIDQCTSTSNEATCGSGMGVTSWVLQ